MYILMPMSLGSCQDSFSIHVFQKYAVCLSGRRDRTLYTKGEKVENTGTNKSNLALAVKN